MKLPGDWLLAIARALLDRAIVTDVVEPTVADLRSEWLRAGADRTARLRARVRGYLAFWSLLAISPFAFRRWPGRAPGVPFWQLQRSHDMTTRTRIQLLLALSIVGLAGGYVVARVRPAMYQSSAVIEVIPGRVTPEFGFAPPAVAETARDAKLRASVNVVLSRSRLERVINELDLYARERQSLIMEEIVQRMRDDIDIDMSGSAGTFVIKYTGTHPATVMKVTEKLAAFFKDAGMNEQARSGDDGRAFLEVRIGETGARIESIISGGQKRGQLSRSQVLELEVLEASYKNLLTRREEALAVRELQRRQLGEQVVLVEAAQLPSTPIGLSILATALIGGVIGVDLAVVIMLGAWLWRLFRERRADLARRRALSQG
jgi:hypothetical protein